MAVLTTRDEMAELLVRSPRIAVVGFSTNISKPSHSAPMALVRRGWQVVPVHPTASEVSGIPTVSSLDQIEGHVDLVDVFRPAAEAESIVQQAIAIGAPAVWLQLGIASDAARTLAESAGLDYVEDACAGALARSLNLNPGKAIESR
jgi:predicted CoA-binding protein